MPYYLLQLSYTPEAVKAMVGRPQDRAEAASALVENLGGKLHHLFFCFGEYDVVCLIEGPDDRMMAAGVMAVAAAGTTSRTRTTKLMTSAEAMEAMKMAAEATGYRSPMA